MTSSEPLPDMRSLQEELLWELRNVDHLGLWQAAWTLDCSPGQSADVIDA